MLRLVRLGAHPEHGTFGTLIFNGKPICNTLEPYHRSNAQNISCIPTGMYECKRHNSARYGDNIWKVTNVYGRSYILIHAGNVDEHTEGCIIVGEKFGDLGDKWGVLESKNALRELMSETEDLEEIQLVVTESF